jgi:hypothetical protein
MRAALFKASQRLTLEVKDQKAALAHQHLSQMVVAVEARQDDAGIKERLKLPSALLDAIAALQQRFD